MGRSITYAHVMNVSPELHRLLSAIRKLTPTERRYIVAQIEAQGVPAAVEPSHAADWLVAGLERELKRRGVLLGPLTAELLRHFAPSYAKEAALVRAALKAKLGRNRTHAELLAFGRVCARALAEYKISENANYRTFSPQMLLRGVSEIPVALERAFPGYLAAGILAAVVKV
jgi:hypothetical protein